MIQTVSETSACSELYDECFYVPNSPESLSYHVQEMLDNNHKHDAVDGDEQVHQVPKGTPALATR